jgi:hypothetical protein
MRLLRVRRPRSCRDLLPDKTSAVDPPVPAHGEMASPEQIREATRAAEEEDAED